jgi:small subunit ribosomal protein S2
VDWVIPGNDDALRAIRLFASKIADSIVEGAQAANDKETAEFSAAVGSATEEAAAIEASPESGDVDAAAATGEDLSMEDVLGGPIRKSPAKATEAAPAEVEAAQHVETKG